MTTDSLDNPSSAVAAEEGISPLDEETHHDHDPGGQEPKSGAPVPSPRTAPETKDQAPVAPAAPGADQLGEPPVVAPLAVAATITVHKAGSRTGSPSSSGASGLNGATFAAYAMGTSTDQAIPATPPVDTCVTGEGVNPSGVCTLDVTDGSRYLVVETAAPSGWATIDQIALGEAFDAGTPRPYRWNVLVGTGTTNVDVPRTAIVNSGTQTWDNRPNASSLGNYSWADVKDNNPYPARCGIDVALVFDLSASIGSNLPTMKNAANKFVDTLVGTPSSFAVFNFATSAPAAGNSNFPIKVSVAESSTAVKATIAGLVGRPSDTTGSTNWDEGLRRVASATQKYDVVLMLTDGNPTSWAGETSTGGTVNDYDIESAVHSANWVKSQFNGAQKTRIVAVGISGTQGGLNTINLKLISGPNWNDDYFATTFDELESTLKAVALATCGGTVNVIKKIASTWTGIEGVAPNTNWSFNASGDGVTPPTATTAVDGVATFEVDFDAPQPERDVTITEDANADYTLLQDGSLNTRCNVDSSRIVNTANGFTIKDLSNAEIVSCTVVNAPGSIEIQKEVETSLGSGTFAETGEYVSGDTASFRVKVTNISAVVLKDVAVTDMLAPNCARMIGELAPGEETTHICTLSVTAALTNTAVTTSRTPGGGTVTDDDTASVVIATPKIDVEKSVWDGAVFVDADSPTGPSLLSVTNPVFKFVVTNNGRFPLGSITLIDDPTIASFKADRALTTACTIPTTLASGATFTCYGTLPWAAGQQTDTATTAGTYDGRTYQDKDNANYFGANPRIDVQKFISIDHGALWQDADDPTGPEVAENTSVRFKYVVTNTGDVALTSVQLTDNVFAFSGNECANVTGSLAVGQTLECVIERTLNTVGQHVNEATAKGTYGATQVTDKDKAHAKVTNVLPSIVVTKTADPTTVPETGGSVRFRFTAKDTSPAMEPVTITVLSDNEFGTLTGDADCQVGTVLAWDATCTFEVTFAIPAGQTGGTHVNVFTARAVDNEQSEAITTDDATVTYRPTVPEAPKDVRAIADYLFAEVSWTAPTSDGGAPITRYTATSAPGSFQCTTEGATSCAVQGLTPGVQYTFTVVAANISGSSAPSAPSNPVTLPYSPVLMDSDGDGALDAQDACPATPGPVSHEGCPLPPPPPAPAPLTVTTVVKAVDRSNKLYLNVNPNRGSGYWTFRVQKRASPGAWKTLTTKYKTYGIGETRTLNLRKGTYRVVVEGKYGYLGVTSTEVYLKR